MTSFSIADMPPMKACWPTRTYWWMPAPPPMMTKSWIVQWPASMTLLEKMTSFPTVQSCATWELARNRQRSPTAVRMAPPAVPGFIVTPSRMVQSAPIVSVEGSPAYFRSWGACPIEAKG